MLVGAIAHALQPTRKLLVLPFCWLLAALAFADGIVPLFRRPSLDAAPGGSIRVISLNCAGTADAGNEVAAYHPDIVLLQEVQGTNAVALLARRLFGTNGAYVSGFDCAVIARGPFGTSQHHDTHFTSATVTMPNGRTVMVTSLRLVPPETRSDLWNPAAWKAYTQNRQERLRELRSIVASVGKTPAQIVGGDFNAPAGDAIYKILTSYTDCYAEAGRGWGHTGLNNIPVVRPDEIWVKGMHPLAASSVKTVYSDHRMVVADVGL